MRTGVFLCVLLLSACAHPSKVSSTLEMKRKTPDTVVITLKIKNLEDHATTPIVPDVVIQSQTDGAWQKPQQVIHTAAFVLNRHEEHDLTANVKTDAKVIRATITIKEGETGQVIKNERVQMAVGPATSQR